MSNYVYLVKGEFQKIGSFKLMLLIIISALATLGLSLAFILYKKEYIISEGLMTMQPIISITAYFATFVLVVFSSITWYYIISFENKNGTWSILLTKPISKNKLLLTKHALNLVLYIGFNILYTLASFIILKITNVELDVSEFLKLQFIFSLVAITIPYSQLLFHLMVKNGLLAVSLSILILFLFLMKDNIPDIITVFIPLLSVDNVWLDITNVGVTTLYCIGSVLYGLVIFLISIKNNYYTYE
ncbi:ABC transporter permease [Lysinibacillus xylanilyticus]|uniref:ABC transporter permease n=1 Tax=Lysinibacillus xylanilyticus TaxID=582475 RepID=UPI002B248E9E|nr:ABC transporter permease [Lysinibacillus xylanilyticus]MEB2302193.1 ABC transporter permease [Lysinibacillus xylanilyticus]